MNPRRVAELHREIAALHAELADAMTPTDAAPATEEGRPRRRKPKTHPAPLGVPTDLDAARARRMLRRRGIAT